jgi:hypothetical protein
VKESGEAEAIKEAAKEFKVGTLCGIGLLQGERIIRLSS